MIQPTFYQRTGEQKSVKGNNSASILSLEAGRQKIVHLNTCAGKEKGINEINSSRN